jgi:hypothetical protein
MATAELMRSCPALIGAAGGDAGHQASSFVHDQMMAILRPCFSGVNNCRRTNTVRAFRHLNRVELRYPSWWAETCSEGDASLGSGFPLRGLRSRWPFWWSAMAVMRGCRRRAANGPNAARMRT